MKKVKRNKPKPRLPMEAINSIGRGRVMKKEYNRTKEKESLRNYIKGELDGA